MGKVGFASEVFNCSAPDTGNMEVLNRYGTLEQKERWLRPLMNGEIRSAFLMTEPAVASSDATNIETEIERDGDDYVINGRKWWSSGVGDPRCKVAIVMGKTNPDSERHASSSRRCWCRSDAPGVKIVRMLPVFGYDDAPHGHAEVMLKNVRVPVENACCSAKAAASRSPRGASARAASTTACAPSASAEVALEKMCKRLHEPQGVRQVHLRALGLGTARRRRPHRHRDVPPALPQGRRHDGQGRQQVRPAGDRDDQGRGAQAWRCKIIDDAIQAHGGGGVTSDFGLAAAYASQRTLRLADGPDEVHNRTIARMEFAKYGDAVVKLRNEAEEKLLVAGIR